MRGGGGEAQATRLAKTVSNPRAVRVLTGAIPASRKTTEFWTILSITESGCFGPHVRSKYTEATPVVNAIARGRLTPSGEPCYTLPLVLTARARALFPSVKPQPVFVCPLPSGPRSHAASGAAWCFALVSGRAA